MTTKNTLPSITLTVDELHRLMKPLIPLAGKDDRFTVLTCVHVVARDDEDAVYGEVTDRFRVGIQRVQPVTKTGVFDALLPLVDVKRLLTVFKPVRGADSPDVTLTLEHTGVVWVTSTGGLGFDLADIKFGIHVNVSNYPKLADLFAAAGEQRDAVALSAIGVNPTYLADFLPAARLNEARALLVRMPRTQGKPATIFAGEDFIGLLMPRTPDVDADVEVLTEKTLAAWRDTFKKLSSATPTKKQRAAS